MLLHACFHFFLWCRAPSFHVKDSLRRLSERHRSRGRLRLCDSSSKEVPCTARLPRWNELSTHLKFDLIFCQEACLKNREAFSGWRLKGNTLQLISRHFPRVVFYYQLPKSPILCRRSVGVHLWGPFAVGVNSVQGGHKTPATWLAITLL